MNLEYIIHAVECLQVIGDTKVEVKALGFDSRQASAGTLFFALPGTKVDGHTFIDEVTAKGAVAVICERLPINLLPSVCYIRVKSTNQAMGLMAAVFYGQSSTKLKLIGVTGTNGKTTTATLLYHLFRKLGHKAGLLSTIAVEVDGERREATHTTPDSLQINKLLHDMVELGCEYCFMEVSSHSVVQGRIAGLVFAGGIFSNITHDHLDYHKTFDEYIRAKKGFFDSLPAGSFALVNTDDRNGRVMVQNTKAQVKTYALLSPADFKCRVLEHSFDGMQLAVDDMEVWVRFVGRFNAYNLLAVYACSVLLGIDKLEALTILSTLEPVSGRFESIRLSSGVTAVLDYAHTPDALLNVLNTINDVRDGDSALIIVVGCGGNRDKTKRPEMAQIGVLNSTKLILTSDNPRFERPEDIIEDMKAGLDRAQLSQTLCITDRKEAIKTALMLAQKGDIVLIAGKGHENYQDVQGVKHHFDDKEIVLELG